MKRVLTIAVTLAMTLGIVSLWVSSARAVLYEVEIENFSFIPSKLHIVPGDVIQWKNRDNVNHSSTSDTGVWNSGILLPNATFTFAFASPGTYPYHCSVHPSMKDTVFVESPTGIDDRSGSTPEHFALTQNYPNPFNAQTEIGFSLPVDSHVKITVFDLLGQKVKILLDGDESAGAHQVVWDAGAVPSGVYFYRIEAADFVQTRKMMLAK